MNAAGRCRGRGALDIVARLYREAMCPAASGQTATPGCAGRLTLMRPMRPVDRWSVVPGFRAATVGASAHGARGIGSRFASLGYESRISTVSAASCRYSMLDTPYGSVPVVSTAQDNALCDQRSLHSISKCVMGVHVQWAMGRRRTTGRSPCAHARTLQRSRLEAERPAPARGTGWQITVVLGREYERVESWIQLLTPVRAPPWPEPRPCRRGGAASWATGDRVARRRSRPARRCVEPVAAATGVSRET